MRLTFHPVLGLGGAWWWVIPKWSAERYLYMENRGVITIKSRQVSLQGEPEIHVSITVEIRGIPFYLGQRVSSLGRAEGSYLYREEEFLSMESTGVHNAGQQRILQLLDQAHFQFHCSFSGNRIAKEKKKSAVTHAIFQQLSHKLLWLITFFKVRYLH